MNQTDQVELTVEVNATDSTTEYLDQITRQLFLEIRQMDVESVDLVKSGPAPHGAKSVDPITTGAIAIAVLPTFLPKIVEAVQAWALRGSNRTVKFKGKIKGQVIEFEGSSEDLEKILEILSKGKK